jgi:surface carbohydrate biosynthesis protein
MQQPRIALLVDHPQRDLPGLVLTALELIRRGAVCHLVPYNLAHLEVWSLGPDFVLLNFLRQVNSEFAERMRHAGIPFGVLDTEGAVFSYIDQYAQLLDRVGNIARAASCYCMWGPALPDYLLTRNLLSADQVTVTGCPRFDFYSAPWRAAFEEPAPAEKQGPPRILINTAYATINSRFTTEAHNVEVMLRIGVPEQEIRDLLQSEREGIVRMRELVRHLALDFPEATVVLRPHPFEDPSYYSSVLGNLPNIEMNVSGPVQPQIFRAAAVIQRSCSTGIEAVIAGVPTLSPQWVTPYQLVPIAEAVSVPSANYEEMRAQLEAILSGSYRTPTPMEQATRSVIQDYFYRIDGDSHRRVAETLLKLVGGRPPKYGVLRRNVYQLDTPQPRTGWMTSYLRYVLHLSPDWSFRTLKVVPQSLWTSTDKYFGVSQVTSLVDRILPIFRANAANVPPIGVARALDRGDFSFGYIGHSVTLSAQS